MKYRINMLMLLSKSGVAVAGNERPPMDDDPKPYSCNLEPKYSEKDPES